MTIRKFALFGAIIGAFALSACNPVANEVTADELASERTMQQTLQAERVVPPPSITQFTEKRTLHRILELRDQGLLTYAYSRSDFDGKLQFLCEAIGYAIPYSTQSTNPERIVDEVEINKHMRSNRYSEFALTLPQPEPMGLHIPDGVAATYVICSKPDNPLNADGSQPFDAIYWEPDLIVSPIKLNASCNLVGDENPC